MGFDYGEEIEDESYLTQEKPYYVFDTFDTLVNYIRETPGSYYERAHDLPKRCVYGNLWGDNFGTITYVTDDGRAALLWAFKKHGIGWFFIYPSDDTLQYFYIHAREHIAAVLNNNKKTYKVEAMNETNDKGRICWPDFENTYLRVEPGTTIDVTLTNWRQEKKSYGTQDPRTALVFDVTKSGGVEHKPALEWSTTSPGLAYEFKPLIEKAEAAGKKEIFVRMKRGTDKKYMVIELG